MLHRAEAALPIAILWVAVRMSQGGEVLCTASSWETYVGAPVQIEVIIKDVRVYEPPAFPDVSGAEVREARQQGQEYPRVTRPSNREGQTVIYTYAVIPRQAGTLTIPPIRVTADGELFTTSPVQIVAKESVAGDLLFLELLGEPESVYVGESVEATLEIWLKPYKNNNIRMGPENMWRYTINEHASAWGPFMENLNARPQNIAYRTESRPDDSGNARRYFVYSLSCEVWPQRPGAFDADGIKVVVDYPLKMRRRRATSLGRPYEVVESRPISVEVQDPKIVVMALPAEGRPDSFRGAVGRYSMTVRATPTEVHIGDPITLTLTIRGMGRMDSLQAPLLADQESLTVDFRVPAEELAGTAGDMVKVFNQTIRAKHSSVTSIPPIRFSYFDPKTKQYVTLESDPIPLAVEESTQLVVPSVVGGGEYGPGQTELTPVETGLLANYDDLQALLTQQSVSVGWGTWTWALSGPALWLACLLAQRHRDRVVVDAVERRRSARKMAMEVIRRAIADEDGSAAASHAAAAVTGYVADRCSLPPGNVTRNDVINQLRQRNLPETTIDKVDVLLAECEMVQYGAVERASVQDLIERARDCVYRLERRKL